MSNPRHFNSKIKGDQRPNSNYQSRGSAFNTMQNTSAKTMHQLPNNNTHLPPQPHNVPIPNQHHQHYAPHPHMNIGHSLSQLNNAMQAPQGFNQPNRQPMNPRMLNRNFQRTSNAQVNYVVPGPFDPTSAMVFNQNPNFPIFPPNLMPQFSYYTQQILSSQIPNSRFNVPPNQPPTSMPEVQTQSIENQKVPTNQLPIPTNCTTLQPKTQFKKMVEIRDPKTNKVVDINDLANQPIDNKANTTTTTNTNDPLINSENQKFNIITDNHDPVADKQQQIEQNDQNKLESIKRNEDKNENLMTNSLTTKNVVTTKDVNVEKQALKKNNETQMTDKSNQQSDLQKDSNLEVHKLIDQEVESQMGQIQPSSNISTPNLVVKQENISPVIDKKTSLTSNEPIVQKEKSKDDNQMLNIVEQKLDKLKVIDSTQDKKLVLNEKQDEKKIDKKQIETKPVDINIDKNVELKQQVINLSNDNICSLADKSNVEEQRIHKQGLVPINDPIKPQQSSQQTTQPQTTNVIKSQSSLSQVQTKVATKTPITNEEPIKANLESDQSKVATKRPLSYDVNFLKELQDSDASTQRPDFGSLNGKGVEIFLNKPRSKHDTQLVLNCGNNDLDPHYFRQGNPNLMYGRYSNSTQLGSRMNPENKGPRKILSNSLNQEVKLRQAENAWRPDRERNYEESAEALIKKARGMLNKLTPQNFAKISQQFLTLKIDTPEKLRKMIELIFDKAVDEPAFCEQYALLCDTMSHLTVPNPESNPETKIKFNTLLLERCQNCFETDKYKDININERLEKIKNCKDMEKKKQLIDDLDEEKRLVRKKSLGNIKLIGALYKNKKLIDKIMGLCIETLIKNKDDDSYECLCSLLKSIGEKFENNTKDKNKFIDQMKQLEQVVKANKVASRIKFLIMDVLDMRKEGWKLRKLQDVNKPKTIEEVHEEAKRLEEQSNREINNQMGKRNDSMRKGPSNNAWTGSTHARKSQNSSDALANIRKITEQRAFDTPSLGPPSFNSPKNAWSLGASGARQSSISSDKKNVNQLQNRNNNSNSSQLGDYNKASTSLVKKNPFRGTYKAGSNYSLIESYSKQIKEYVKSYSLDILIDSIYEISTEESTHLFVISAIENACESMLKNINDIGDLLCKLVIDKKVISYQQFHKGLKHHLDISQDLITDVPKFFEYIGQILSHFYFKISDEDRKSFFKNALEPCFHFDTSIEILAHLIENLVKEHALAEVVKKWSISKMSFADFSKKTEDEIKENLIKEVNFRNFITELSNCKVSSNSSNRSNLCGQIINDAKFEDIPKLINQGLSSNDVNANKLICALFERCIKDSIEINQNEHYTFQEQRFNDKMKIMPQIKELKEIDVQLEVIYTITKLVMVDYQNPKGLICHILASLFDNKYIKKSAFLKWSNDDDKNRIGNSLALILCKRFIEDISKEED